MRLPSGHFKIGRRNFVRLSAAGAAGLYVASCSGDPVERVRALVIGSGFGGSISALRLAQAGVAVTVLERGKRWDLSPTYDTFASMIAPDGRAAWMSRTPVVPGYPAIRLRMSPYVGVLQKFLSTNLNVVCAAGVGGGSLVYSGIMIQPPRALFESVFPADVDYTQMDEVYYPRVREMMSPGAMPDDVLAADPYLSSRIFLRDAEMASLDVERNTVALDWDRVRAELSGEVPAQVINGDYLYGLNSGAKRSLDRGYLADAEATGLVDVRPLHQVSAIAQNDDGSYRATVEQIDEHGEVLATVSIDADFLFLAAGSMNTTKLLLRAKRDGTLPGLNDQVGESWGNNGQRILVRSGLEDVGVYHGGPACIFVHDHDNPHGAIGMEFGPAPLGFEHNCLISATQGIPDQLGRLVLNAEDEVEPEWDRAYDENAGLGAEFTLQRMIDAAGGQRGSLPGLDESVTFHPLGGAVLGGVCDAFGRVQGQPSLYVVDSALIPGATPAGNPFWTVAALAERCIETIVLEDLSAPEGE
jgi:cholesterol oxidase